MLAEIGTSYSVKIADSIPRRLVTFGGLDQGQGSWEWCIDVNRRIMPSLAPLSYEPPTGAKSKDYYSFLQSWKAFHKIQRYTDGEAFFLCYPAAVQFGIYTKKGTYDDALFPSWKNSYLHDQQARKSGTEYNSHLFDERIKKKYHVTEKIVPNRQELIELLKTESGKNELHTVQVSCFYPMFGNRRYDHYISIVDTGENNNGIATIAGGLAPFGIYESPIATVDFDQLTQFIETSNKLMFRSRKYTDVDLQDRSKIQGIEVTSIQF